MWWVSEARTNIARLVYGTRPNNTMLGMTGARLMHICSYPGSVASLTSVRDVDDQIAYMTGGHLDPVNRNECMHVWKGHGRHMHAQLRFAATFSVNDDR